MILSGAFGKQNNQAVFAKMMSGGIPVFSQFGQDIYACDVVQMCVDRIASEAAKLQPKHIRTKDDGSIEVVKGNLNRLFQFGPNPLMTVGDFIEKIVWMLLTNFNAFIYPRWDNGECVEMYPLNPVQVTFKQDPSETLYIEFQFASGEKAMLLYSDVIHLRKRFGQHDIMGGGLNGMPDNRALLKVAAINDTLLQGLEKAVKTSLSVRGILKIATALDDKKQQEERERFEELIESGKTGVLPMDLRGEYIDLKPDPKMIDKETLEFLQNKILYHYGVSVPILSGKFTDEEYQAFYEAAISRMVIGLSQGFTKCLFTTRQLDVGNEIVFYPRDLMYLSMKTKLELLKIAGEQGVMDDNQKRQLIGFSPLPGEEGKRRTQSLNFISVDIVDAYQMQRAKLGKDVKKDEDEKDEDE